jgi:single-strand DNA-binding protein
MLNINKVMLTGRLTRDPETKYLPSGMAVTNLSIAVNRNYQDKSGEWKEEVSFIDIETWGKVAERAAESLKKGQPVYVEGRLKQDSWERDGVKQSKIKVTADFARSFEVPQRAGQGGGEYQDESGGGSSHEEYSQPKSSYQSRAAASSQSKPQQPSDALNFGKPNAAGSTSDDMPF